MMQYGFTIHPYSAAMGASALIAVLLAARAWMGTKKALSRAFAFYQIGIFVWSLFRLVQFEIISPRGQLEALKLQYIGIVFLPGAFYMIARALSKRPVKVWELPLALFLGILALPLIATNPLHRFFWVGNELELLPIHPEGGWAFWLFLLAGYAQVLLSLGLMIGAAIRAKGAFARWIRQFIVLLAIPIAVNALFILLFFKKTGYDPTPIAYAITGLILVRTLRHFDIFEVVPYAKNVVLESIDTPLLVADAEGLVVGANEEARRLSPGLDSLEGRPIVELVPALKGVYRDGDTREWSWGGVDYQITCYAVKRERELWRGRIFLFRDVSALVKARREIEDARAKADAANAAKSAFVAVVSHELRNPLNAIIGLADLDLHAHPPPDLREDLEAILSSGNLLLGLVNDLLDLSKIEANKMELEIVDFDLHEKVVSMLKAFRPAVEKKGIFLDIVIEEGTPRYVRGDPLRYGQVLMNFVSNAVKFTDRGAVAVCLSACAQEPGAAASESLCVRTEVRDTGMGVSADQIPKLFQEFSQAEASVARRFGGTGLGLSISKRLVELFGGEVSVKSAVGRGSIFSFTARFAPGEEAKARPVSTRPAGGPAGVALRVLVVDDDPVNNAVARRYLERLGHVADNVGSGQEALSRLREAGYDLVLLDLGLQDMDGFEACRLIRSEDSPRRASGLPIAAMTARAEPGMRGACAAAGMIDCLLKPLDPLALERLLARVTEAAHELGPRAAASVRPPRFPAAERLVAPFPPEPEPGAPLIDLPALLERLDGDQAFSRELLAIFVEEAPGRLEAFARASAAGDIITLQRLAHALKGSSLSLCARPLSAAVSAVESACIAAALGDSGPGAAPEPIPGRVEALAVVLADTLESAKAILGPGAPASA